MSSEVRDDDGRPPGDQVKQSTSTYQTTNRDVDENGNLEATSMSTTESSPGSTTQPCRPHRLVTVSVRQPHLCAFCQDYVVTPRLTAQQCQHCRLLFHAVCSSRLTTASSVQLSPSVFYCSPSTDLAANTTVAEADLGSEALARGGISTEVQPVINWSAKDVVKWLSVVGLGRFVVLFSRFGDGARLAELVPYSSTLDQIIDPFARQALRRAVLSLTGAQPMVGEDVAQFSVGRANGLEATQEPESASVGDPAKQNGAHFDRSHDWKVVTFLREVACVACGLALLGVVQQGYQCQVCGQIIHRLCKVVVAAATASSLSFGCGCPGPPSSDNGWDLPGGGGGEASDSLDYAHLPRMLKPHESRFFGVSLGKQPLDQKTHAPVFLTVCTRQLEELAAESVEAATCNPAAQPIDLEAAYQQSALTSQLRELHASFAQQLPNGADGAVPLEPVRLAQLIKAFFRDLPQPIIPERLYDQFCGLGAGQQAKTAVLGSKASVSSQSAARYFIDQLPEINRDCLTHLVHHMDFVWSYQHQLASCAGDQPRDPVAVSSTLLLVFRQILIRPPWAKLTDIAMAMDVHVRALQAVVSELSNLPSASTLLASSKRASRWAVPAPSSSQRPLSVGQRPLGGGVQDTYDVLHSSSTASSSLRSTFTCLGDGSPAPTVNTPPSPASVEANKRDLATREWYWGDVARAEVREIMAGLPDGCFLVRDASEQSAGAFTLTVRWHGENKLNRIYHRGDFFGVVDPPPTTFRLVSQLISFYHQLSPRPGDPVGLQLIKPVTRRSQPGRQLLSTLRETVGDEKQQQRRLFTELRRTDDKLGKCESQMHRLLDEAYDSQVEKEAASRLIKANRTVNEWLRQQVSLLDSNKYAVMQLSAQERARIDEHHQGLLDHLQETQRQIEANKNSHSLRRNQSGCLIEQQVHALAQTTNLKRQAQQIRRALKDYGIPEEDLVTGDGDNQVAGLPRRSDFDSTLSVAAAASQCRGSPGRPGTSWARASNLEHSPVDGDDIGNRRSWLVQGLSRVQAEELLAGRPTGTFLIRPSGSEAKLALSVRVGSTVQHCLINQVDGKYGFIHGTFDSLEALVRHYSVHSLKSHNPALTTSLCYPVYGSQADSNR